MQWPWLSSMSVFEFDLKSWDHFVFCARVALRTVASLPELSTGER